MFNSEEDEYSHMSQHQCLWASMQRKTPQCNILLFRAGISNGTSCSKSANKRNDYRRSDAENICVESHIHSRYNLVYNPVKV